MTTITTSKSCRRSQTRATSSGGSSSNQQQQQQQQQQQHAGRQVGKKRRNHPWSAQSCCPYRNTTPTLSRLIRSCRCCACEPAKGRRRVTATSASEGAAHET